MKVILILMIALINNSNINKMYKNLRKESSGNRNKGRLTILLKINKLINSCLIKSQISL